MQTTKFFGGVNFLLALPLPNHVLLHNGIVAPSDRAVSWVLLLEYLRCLGMVRLPIGLGVAINFKLFSVWEVDDVSTAKAFALQAGCIQGSSLLLQYLRAMFVV